VLPGLSLLGDSVAGAVVGSSDPRDWRLLLDTALARSLAEPLAEGVWTALKGRCGAKLVEAHRPLLSYLHSLGLTPPELAALVTSHATLLRSPVARAASRVALLAAQCALEGPDLARVLAAAPGLLFMKDETLTTGRPGRCLALFRELGVPPAEWARAVAREPRLLAADAEGLAAHAAHLAYVLKLSDGDIGRMAARHPKLLVATEACNESRLLYLFNLGLDDEAVRKMVVSHPQLLNYAPGSMAPRVAWLREEVGMSAEEVVRTVTRLSQLFSLSVERSLRPKYAYLVGELGGGKQTLLDCPAYLSLSLAQRIVPRHTFLARRNKAQLPFNVFQFIHADARFAAAAGVPLKEWCAYRDAHCADAAEAASLLPLAVDAVRPPPMRWAAAAREEEVAMSR